MLDIPRVLRPTGVELERDQVPRGRHGHDDALDTVRTRPIDYGRLPRSASDDQIDDCGTRRRECCDSRQRIVQVTNADVDLHALALECRPGRAAQWPGIGREEVEIECRPRNAVDGHRGRSDNGKRDALVAQHGHDLREEVQSISS